MKMKKGLALLLAACSCFAFAACEEEAPQTPQEPEHEHAYATEWTKDETDHWHACTGEDCTEVADKAVHEWNAGEITTEASASADGVKTFTCTVCAQTKTESVPYVVDTEVTAEEWLAALSFANEDNYKVSSVATGLEQHTEYDGATIHMYGISPMGEAIDQYATKEGETYALYSVSGGTVRKTTVPKTAYDNMKSCGLDTTFLFGDFQYDETSKTYKASEISYGQGMLRYTNVEVAFEDGKLARMTYNYFYQGGAPFVTTTTVTYGGVQTLAIPTNTVDEAQMLAAFENAKNDQVSKCVTFSYGGDSAMTFIINGDKYSYSTPNVSEYVLAVDGFKIYSREYDESAGAWGAWTVRTAASEASFLQSYEYMNKPNLYLKYYAPASFADMNQTADGGYEYTIAGNDDYDSYKVYFVGGKLTKFVVYDGNDVYTLDYKYDNVPVIEIPQDATPAD